jgi:hypothetical protein
VFVADLKSFTSPANFSGNADYDVLLPALKSSGYLLILSPFSLVYTVVLTFLTRPTYHAWQVT